MFVVISTTVMRMNFARLLRISAAVRRKKSSQSIASNVSLASQFSITGRATVLPKSNLNGEEAARSLHGALRGIVSDTNVIINILASATNRQRQKIKRYYRLLYCTELDDDVDRHLAGLVRDVVLALLKEPQLLLAEHIHHLLMKVRADETALVELLYGWSNSKMTRLKNCYRKRYGQELSEAVRKRHTGDLSKLLRILTNEREERKELDLGLAYSEAEILAAAGVGIRYETDDAVVSDLLLSRSYPHLRVVFNHYHNLTGKPIEDSIRMDFRGGLRDGLLAFVKAVKNPPQFYAECIGEIFIDSDPDDQKLIRILVLRSEVDLADIKDSYLSLNGTKLVNTICDETSGDYRKILLKLLGH